MKKIKAKETDYTYNDLPSNRVNVFLDVIKNQWRKLLLLGLVLLLAFLPYLIIIFLRDNYLLGVSQGLSQGKITQEDAYKLYCIAHLIAAFASWISFYFLFFPLGGVIRIVRQLVWGDPVFIKEDLLIGSKQNYKFGAILATYIGIAVVISKLVFFVTNNVILQSIPLALFLAFLLPPLLITYCEGTIYQGKFSSLFHNAVLIYIKKAPHALLFTLILSLPTFIKYIQSYIVIKYIVLVVVILFVLILLLLIFYLFSNYLFDIFINVTHYPEMIRKGMNKNKQMIKKNNDMVKMELIGIINQFNIKGTVKSCESYGHGHINVTYRVVTSEETYILQNINQRIFPDVDGLMNNIKQVLDFLKNEIVKRGGDPLRETMTLIPTKDGKNYFYDKKDNKYYRLYLFISDSFVRQIASNKEEFSSSGTAFGQFQKLLANFDASKLIEVIPNFHNTTKRFEHFKKALEKDEYDRAKNCQNEIDFILKREKDCNVIVSLINEHKIPLKVTHNDTKLNNVLFDNNTGKCLAVIDFDTIMPGSSLYDFGDSIRFGCNTANEDEKDLSKVNFNIEYFEAYSEAFLKEVKDTMNQFEIDYLAFSAKLLTFENGIRFLDDYLCGNKYFATKYEEHNLVRARTQLKLVSLMEDNMNGMNQIIHKITRK